MEGIIISLVEKVIGFFKEDRNKNNNESSKDVAKNRLQFVLVQDRIKLTPEQMENLRGELVEVMQKYIDVEDDRIEMEITREEEMMAMIANFPLKNTQD